MSQNLTRSPGVDTHYAQIFLAVARGMVSRPKDLDAYVSAEPDRDGFFTVVAQSHATDHGTLIGKFGAHMGAFRVLLRAASSRREEECALFIEEGFGRKAPTPEKLLDPRWDRDAELARLVAQVAGACFPGVRNAKARTEKGHTIITIETNAGLAEEYLEALQTLFKAWGRNNGRTVRLEGR